MRYEINERELGFRCHKRNYVNAGKNKMNLWPKRHKFGHVLAGLKMEVSFEGGCWCSRGF